MQSLAESTTDARSKAHSSNACLRVPKGFFTLMEMFVKALLKNKPLDVFTYGARFFEHLLQMRTDLGHDPVVHGARSEDGFTAVGMQIHTKCGKPNCKKCLKNKHKNGRHVAYRSALSQGSDRRDDLEPGETTV